MGLLFCISGPPGVYLLRGESLEQPWQGFGSSLEILHEIWQTWAQQLSRYQTLLVYIIWKGIKSHNKKFSYRWQTARRVYRSVKVIKHGTIRYVRYGFIFVCYRNYVRKTHPPFLKIFDFKNAVTLKIGWRFREGHWKCYHLIDSLWLPIDVLITMVMALSRVVSEFFNVENIATLKSQSSQSRSFRLIESGIIRYIGYGFLFAFYSNFVPKRYSTSNVRDLENRVRVPSRSLKCHHSIERMWLPINVSLQPWAYLVPFPR